MIVKLLTEHHLEFLSLQGGCRGSSGSTLVKMSNCWKSQALAYFRLFKKKVALLASGQTSETRCTTDSDINTCPTKTHHPSDALSCGLSKIVETCVIFIYYSGQMQCFRTKNQFQ